MAERERIEREAMQERERALLANELVIEPGPYEAHVGFSNVCNMSCIMCWDGANPPARKMTPHVLERLAEQVAPSLSVITPYNGSEPLIVAWDETRHLAERHSIELTITTNAQFLTERRFEELAGITETLFISIDSYIPELFAKIRPGSKPAAVFENLHTAAPAARRAGLECIANIVFMTETGPLMPETIEYLADAGIEAVHVLQMLDVNGRSGWSNALVHFSPGYVALIKQRCMDVARRRELRLIWDVAGIEDHDFRPPRRRTEPKPRKVEYDHWDWRMKNHLPGFCRNVYDRLRIDTNGSVAPCSYSTDGELELGNLADTPFEEMWNGPRMRDLRRAHYTGDYPGICASCRFSDPPPPRDRLPFAVNILDGLGFEMDQRQWTIPLLAPEHMTRSTRPPVLCFEQPGAAVDTLFVVLALGGEAEELEAWPVAPGDREGATVQFEVPAEIWDRLRPNLAWWWAVFGLSSSDPSIGLCSSEIRCVIRHQRIPRIAGSGLRYPDQGLLPVVDLGSKNGVRPSLTERETGNPFGDRTRHVGAA